MRIGDAQLRQQARKSAASAALNTAEGAARQTGGDKARAYGIALAECCEACAAVEIAGALGACSASDVAAVVALVPGGARHRLQAPCLGGPVLDSPSDLLQLRGAELVLAPHSSVACLLTPDRGSRERTGDPASEVQVRR